jgi:hypothetical protein
MAIPEGFTVEQKAGAIPEGFTPDEESGKKFQATNIVDKILMKIPGMPTITEFAAANNRSLIDIADFFGPDVINSVLQLSGTEARVPTLQQGARKVGLYADKGAFAGEGLATDVAAAAGSVIPASIGFGAAIRQGAKALPALAPAGEPAAPAIIRQMATSTPAQDVGFGVVAAAGGEIGEEAAGMPGRVVASFLAPLSVGAVQSRLSSIVSNPSQATQLVRSLSSMSDEGAAKFLADAMIREGLSPDDVAERLAQLGPDAIPADISNTFSRLLRSASNEIPRIQGRATNVLNQRQSGQAARISSSLDSGLGVPGIGLDDEIIRLDQVSKPIITRLYENARANPLPISGRLRTLFDGDNSLADAFKGAQRRVADKRAMGDEITHFDVINATKQEMDDQIGTAIRAGENNRARDLVRLKNLMVDEADTALPGYKAARDAFAGRMALEAAADQGTLFMSLNPREVEAITKSMGESELRMFRLGAKQAILDRIEMTQESADLTKRLFGRNGDVAKLRSLFPSDRSFQQFSDTLEREAQFSMTRRAAQANSSTAQQTIDSSNVAATGRRIASAVNNPNPLAIASEVENIVSGLAAKKGTQAHAEALAKAGDILLDRGMDPQRLRAILLQGDSGRLSAMLRSSMTRNATPSSLSVVGAGVSGTTGETQ